MKHLRILCISVLIGFMAGLSTPGWADDTDLYLSQALKLSKKTYPNVLFMLDNSGSMNDKMRTDDGVDLGVTRMTVLKQALESVINDADSVNLGLARFTYSTDGTIVSGKAVEGTAVNQTNAPIMYPVAYVDAPIEEVESGDANAAVMIPSSASLAQGSDDAEENVETKAVSITDTNLEMVTQEVPPGIKYENRVTRNDTIKTVHAMENLTTHSVKTSGPMFFGKEITNDKNVDNGEVLTGIRFYQLSIPQGAKIYKAEVDFTSDDGPQKVEYKDWDENVAYDNDKHPLDLKIEGSTGDNFVSSKASLLSDVQFYPRITDDSGVLATVNWPIRGKVVDKQVYTTPDVGPILQSLVNKTTWAPGNNFVLLFKRIGTVDESARRGFVTVDNTLYSDAAPLLRVYWSASGDGESFVATGTGDTVKYVKKEPPGAASDYMRLGYNPLTSANMPGPSVIGVRFAVPIPAGATITDAKIIFTRQGQRSGWANGKGTPIEDAEKYGFPKTLSTDTLNLKISAEKVAAAVGFVATDTTALLKRIQNPTNEIIDWQIPATTKPVDTDTDPTNNTPETLDRFETPNISKILTEVIGLPDWKVNNYVSFFFERPSNSTNQNYRRFVEPGEGTASAANAIAATADTLPRLEVTYTAGSSKAGEVKQLVGLRFENVEIPQGAKVTKASIDFTGGSPAINATSIMVQAEDVDNAKTFSSEAGDISSRKLTLAKTSWNVESWSNQAVAYSSVDISNVVQAVVNRSGWCGGTQAMAFVLSGSGLRNASAFDHSPDKAPVLNFEYDLKQINGSGCINQSFRTQVASDNDDAEEVSDESGKMYLTTALDLGRKTSEDRTTAVRFRDVPFDNGVTIMKAELTFTAAVNTKTEDMNGTVSIQGQKTSAQDFTSGDYDLTRSSTRPKTSAKVPWTLAAQCAEGAGGCTPAWRSGVKYSVDVTPIVQELLSQSSWEKYNSMAFFVSGTGHREAHSAGTSTAGAPQLRIQVQGSLGSEIAVTVRTRLKQIAKSLKPADYTPIVDALYESGIYYREGPVTFGKDRYEVRNHFVSHSATYTGGKAEGPLAPYQCSWDKASKPVVTALNCQHEKITGDAQYKTPMSSPCQNSYIVLLTDGIPTKNTSKELVKKLVGVDSCQKVEYDIDGKKQSVSNGECGFELADFLYTSDNAPDLEGTQKIVTHTIGFQLGKGWVKVQDKDNCITPEVDADGKPVVGTDGKPVCAKYGSKYVEDIRETQINAAAQRYLADLSAKGHGQFFPINATNPEEAVQLLKNAFESILAQAVTSSTAFAAPSISVSTVSRLYHKNEVYFALFKPDQNAMWEGNIKKYRICEAGGSCKAGDILDSTGSSAVLNGYIAPDSRSIWNDGAQPDGAEIIQGGAGAKIPSPSGRKIYTYTGGEAAPGENHKIILSEETVSVANKKLTAEALGLTTEGLSADQEEQKRKELINWIRGEHSTGEQRWRFGDPLHSSPVALVYAGGADKKGTTRLFVGTNDGLVRVINADDNSGQEMWAFLPQELLSIQAGLKKNEAGHRIYGVDATPTFLVNDGGDGIIDKDKGDSAQMFIGMRRGGTNLYALDVTDPDAPQLMWVIKGSKAVNGASQTSSPGFEKLGQTWSKPKPVRVAHFSSKPVLLFGGGYHETQDESFSKVESGNAIYMVDTETGELVWWASSSKGKTESAAPFLELKGMDYAIPSDLALLDTKGAGVVNRIYVGDANGQVWRIDLDVGKNGVGGRLATLSGDPPTGVTNENKRRFFYPPDVVTRIKTGDLIYDLVVIVSGTRPDPLGTSTHDQFYALRDFAINGLVDKDDDGNADVDKTSFATLTAGDLVDVTDYIVPKSEGEASVVIEGLNDSKGWFVNLNQQPDKGEWAGEKGLASPIVLKGKVYFTTYLPPSGKEKDPCKPSEGKSYLYSLDILSGETALNSKQLALELKAGITSDIVLFFGKEGIRIITNDFSTPIHEELGDVPPGTGNSATNNGCGAGCYTNPANPIFWMQE